MTSLRLTVHDTPEPWLEHRRQGVTSSDIPALLGHGYAGRTIFHLYLDKIRQAEEDPGMKWKFRCGHHMEPLIHERVEEETGWSLWDPGGYAVVEHPEGLLMATVDRLRIAPPGDQGLRGDQPISAHPDGVVTWRAALEFKWFDRSIAAGFQSSKFFAYSLSQVTVAMMCCDVQEGAVVASFGQMDDFAVIPVVRSAAMEEIIWERAREFWAYVEAREVPGPQYVDESKAVGDALSEIYAGETGEVRELGEEWRERILRLKELREEKKELEDEYQEIRNLAARELEGASFGIVPGCERKLKWSKRKGGGFYVDPWEKWSVSDVKA